MATQHKVPKLNVNIVASHLDFVATLTDHYIVIFSQSAFGHIPKFYSSIYYLIITYCS